MAGQSLRYLRWSDPLRALRKGGAVFLAISFGSLNMLGHSVPDRAMAWNLTQDGKETIGIVLRHYTNGTSGKGNCFWVEFQYEAKGSYTGTASITESEWVAYQPGRPIDIWCLPEAPNFHALSPRGALWSTFFYCFLTGLVLSFGVWGTLAVMARTLRHALLRGIGLSTTATVTRIHSESSSSFIAQSWIMIWQDDTGRQGQSDPQVAWFQAREPLPIGTTIPIYADPAGKLPSVWEGDCGPR